MNAKDESILDLARTLGKEYRVAEIDLEQVVYRDFGNGFNVEISGMHNTRASAKATIYLWNGDRMSNCCIVTTVYDVPRSAIGKKVDALYEISEVMAKNNLSREDILKLGSKISYLYG